MKFASDFLTVAQGPQGMGLQQALRLLEKHNGRPDLLVRARLLLAEQRKAALRADAANDDRDDRMAA